MKNKILMLTMVGIMGTTSVAFAQETEEKQVNRISVENTMIFIDGATKLEYDMVDKYESDLFKIQVPVMFEESIGVKEDEFKKNGAMISYVENDIESEIVKIYPVKKGLLTGVKGAKIVASDSEYNYYSLYVDNTAAGDDYEEVENYLKNKLPEILVLSEINEDEKVIDGATKYEMVKVYENDMYEIQVPNVLEKDLLVTKDDTSGNRTSIAYKAEEKTIQIVTIYPVKKGLKSGVRGASIVAENDEYNFYALFQEANSADADYQEALKYLKENINEVLVLKGSNELIFIDGVTKDEELEKLKALNIGTIDINGSQHVKLRETLEGMGYKIAWNGELKLIEVSLDKEAVSFVPEKDMYTTADGTVHLLNDTVKVIDGVSYITLELVAELMELVK